MKQSDEYHVYIVQCADGTLYVGTTNDVVKRIHAHNTLPTGARYTKSRRPVQLVYTETYATKGEALSREIAIKKLKRSEKLLLIQQ